VEALIASTDPQRELIFVGGTGLYFDALVNGFADVPEISPEVVAAVQFELASLDEGERMAMLEREDEDTARRLKVADPQRVIRALAVKRQTGRALSSFQNEQRAGPLAGWSLDRMVLWPERELLRSRIAARFAAMFDNGAVAEVQELLARNLDPSLPAMKAIGVPEISQWLAGQLSTEDAIASATIATQQYAKRQRTWFRNRMADWPRVVPD
jgi:tRNA dimethylallyltransferase